MFCPMLSLKKKRSIVLLSGGLDSAANLAFCKKLDFPLLTLTMHYGQKAAENELRAAKLIAQYYNVPNRVIYLDWLGKLGGNALTNGNKKVPRISKKNLDHFEITRNSAAQVWVPNRNGVFINIAASFAETLKAEQIIVGFNREEARTFPDNSKNFLLAAQRALQWSTRNQDHNSKKTDAMKMNSYTLDWDKRTIVIKLKKHHPQFPFHHIWSCYLGGKKPCRQCESCQRLERALYES